jgi:four helix bundle protein
MSSSYRELKVWQKSFALAQQVYLITKKLPKTEQFGLISQIQRSAVSIPSNIAEGQQRQSPKEFSHFISVARGSAAELSTQLMLAKSVYGLGLDETINDIEEIQKMLYSLQSKIK